MVKGDAGFILGLDLHGTLLEPGEIIRDELVSEVAARLASLRGRLVRFVCTGNDLDFVKRKVPEPIIREMEGCVLETGCSASLDWETEKVLTTAEEIEAMRGLERAIREEGFREINYFAHRLTTISMFCDDPKGFYEKVRDFVEGGDYSGRAHVTYSSVAVDILPPGYDKYQGLFLVAGGKKTIGVADSMNDLALLAKADYAFAPRNMAPELEPILTGRGRDIIPIAEAKGLIENAVILADLSETRGVMRILDFIGKSV